MVGYDLSKFKAERMVFNSDGEGVVKDIVVDVTDYEHGVLEIQIKEHEYIRIRHEDLTAAIMACRVRLLKDD